ncbi:MAG: hypothetical protein ABI162_06275 [Luteolibacter sp.]
MAPSGKSLRYILIGIALAVVMIGIMMIQTRNHPEPPLDRASKNSPDGTSTPERKGPRSKQADDVGVIAPPPGNTATPDAAVAAFIRKSLEDFRDNHDPVQAREFLRLLRESLRQAPEDGAAAAIVDFLKTGADAPTGLPFSVGPDGMMDTVPTLRLALLDLLPSLDPMVALEIARELMDQQTSPDEYALSLRNLAWNDLDGDLHNELTDRFLELLETPWLNQPSAGFLESFDVAVEAGGSRMFDGLISVARGTIAKPNAAVSQATYISLDRMIVRDRTLLTQEFSKEAAWTDFPPQQRASMLSRLDITQPKQRELFVRYLSSVPHPAGELDYFAKIFPNQNYLAGYHLVTAAETTPGIADVMAADAQVLKELDTLTASLTGDAAAAVLKIKQRLAKSAPAASPDR